MKATYVLSHGALWVVGRVCWLFFEGRWLVVLLAGCVFWARIPAPDPPLPSCPDTRKYTIETDRSTYEAITGLEIESPDSQPGEKCRVYKQVLWILEPDAGSWVQARFSR